MSQRRRTDHLIADGAGHQMRRQARLGVLVLEGFAIVGVGTARLLPSATGDRAGTVLGSAALGLVALGALVLPWPRLPRAALLVFPALTFVELAVLQLVGRGSGSTYAGFLVVSFVYAGLVGSVGGVLVLLPLAAATWLLLADVPRTGLSALLVVRLGIAVSVWATVGLVLVRQGAAERKRRSRLVEDSRTDVLTGLDNSRVLDGALDDLRDGDVVVVIDVDGFRQVNAERGQAGGDTVLAEFGRIARVGLRGNDRAIRQGDDEFVFVLGEVNILQVLTVLGRLRDEWQQLCGPVTFSAGAAAPRSGETGREVLRRADQHCYQAKKAGRDQWVLDDAGAAGAEVAPHQAVEASVPAS